jgi:hypothetical protein
VTAWGVAPAQGRLRFCGTCGGVVGFAEERRPGRVSSAEAGGLLLAVEAHFALFPECRKGSTFEGSLISACRCRRPMRLPRAEGLFCSRCDGLISPEVAAQPQERLRPKRGGR